MEITEVRIKLIDNPDDRLRGFCSITFDNAFVVRDLKIIEGNNGPFVAMPSRKLTSNCRKCRCKNHLRANYCNQCGSRLQNDRIEHDSGGRAKLYADVAHPVNAACREMIQNRVIDELNREVELSNQPGYSSRYDDDYFDDDPGPELSEAKATKTPSAETSPAFTDVPEEILKIREAQERQKQSKHRVDAAEDNPKKPHKPDENAMDPEKSTDDEFGKGIF